MIDIHHHLLAGLDDGASDLETSLAMAQIAVEDGITHVVCTPHANNRYEYSPSVIAEKVRDLRQLLKNEGVALEIGTGCDFHLTYDNIQMAKADRARFSINGLGYLLVEIPDYSLPKGLTETFYEFQIAGMTPILTHPERNLTLQSEPGRLDDWMRAGLLLQVTAGSVLGRMGKTARKMAHDLLEKRWVAFLATDAHNITSRPPKMRAAYEEIANRYGSEYAHLLCVSNPLAAFQGQPLAEQAEPMELFDEERPQSWWQKIFG